MPEIETENVECPACGYKGPAKDYVDDICPMCCYDLDDTIRVLEEFYECADRDFN